MSENSSLVAVYAKHVDAEAAVRRVAEAGLDMKQFSILGRGYHSEEQVIGFYSAGDRIKFWGSRGAYWGGLWGLLFGGVMLTVPGVGPVMVLGHLAALVFTAVSGVVEGAILTGGLSALGAALFSIGIPHHSVLQYEQALKVDKYLLIAHGSPAEVEQAKALLQDTEGAEMNYHESSIHASHVAA